MEKIEKSYHNDVLIFTLEYWLWKKSDEMVNWINQHERIFHGMTPEEEVKGRKSFPSDNPKVLRYELSHDSVGLIAFLADGISYHIHSDELTTEQVSIRDQLEKREEYTNK